MFEKAPAATGAFSFVPVSFDPLAGPVEFSTGEVIAILLVLVLASLVLPVLAGVVAVVLYRRRTTQPERTGRAATLEFLKWGAITFVAQFVIGWAISGVA